MRRIAGGHLTVGLVTLFLGGLFGAMQALNYAGVNLYGPINEALPAPLTLNYYMGLTGHGVLLALVHTTFFIMAFLIWATQRALGLPFYSLALERVAFWLMLVGLVLAALPILSNDASVLYTFYPPLKASPLFYIGLTLVVVGTWIITYDLIMSFRRWMGEHPGERTPLPAFMSIVTLIMWVICSLGLAFSMLVHLIPWSLGLVTRVDPLLSRTLFWFTGHAIVYFWLMPAYISWYTILPTQIGGKIFSDTMARVAFIFFLAYSIPVGVHHQFTDPGIGEGIKILQAFFTFIVFFPSLLTAFSICASLESVGWARGDRSHFGFIRYLPWRNPSVVSQLLAMLTFIFGGMGGLVNSSMSMNLLVHNTAYVVGHFHITVGTAVVQTFMGITYWFLPHIAGKPLYSQRLALWQAWTWGIGMTVFSIVLHYLGIQGMPRRSDIGAANYLPDAWRSLLPFVGFGGILMFISGLLFLVNIVLTLRGTRREEVPAPAFADYIHGPVETPALFDRLAPWLAVTILLIVVAYGPVFWAYIANPPPGAPGLRVW